MTEYTPTHNDVCIDPECPAFGKPCVDRGYGYPVCETRPWRSERFLINLPMNPRYLELDNATCIENCTSCLDTGCIFHETNRDTDEHKELSRELRRRIAEVTT